MLQLCEDKLKYYNVCNLTKLLQNTVYFDAIIHIQFIQTYKCHMVPISDMVPNFAVPP